MHTQPIPPHHNSISARFALSTRWEETPPFLASQIQESLA